MATDYSVLKIFFTYGFLISSVGVDNIFSTKYRLFYGEEEATVEGPLG